VVADQISTAATSTRDTGRARGDRHLLQHASGTVEVGLYKGNIFFNALTGCKASIYNEADSSMEASDGLNPVSRRGSRDQSVEARMWRVPGRSRPSEGSMANLKTSYLGWSWRIADCQLEPLTDRADTVADLELAGASAVVMRSISRTDPGGRVRYGRALEGDTSMAALEYLRADLPGQTRSEAYLEKLTAIRKRVGSR
jgi:hypothetical protein